MTGVNNGREYNLEVIEAQREAEYSSLIGFLQMNDGSFGDGKTDILPFLQKQLDTSPNGVFNAITRGCYERTIGAQYMTHFDETLPMRRVAGKGIAKVTLLNYQAHDA